MMPEKKPDAAWTAVGDEAARESWNRWLFSMEDCNVYQSFEWGEYRQAMGERVIRCAAFAAGDGASPAVTGLPATTGLPVALFQATIRQIGPASALWSQGGAAGDLGLCGKGLMRMLARASGRPFCYCRLDAPREMAEEQERRLIACGWRRPSHLFNSGESLLLELGRGEAGLEKGLSKNWRHNLKRSEKAGFTFSPWEKPDAEVLYGLYSAVDELKGIPVQFTLDECRGLLRALSGRLMLWKCVNRSGEIIALRGCGTAGSEARDLLAAANEEARSTYASYALLWRLLLHCDRLGIRRYDLGGIDPAATEGVYNFKKGTGARRMRCLGEWDRANAGLFRWLVNFMLARLLKKRK